MTRKDKKELALSLAKHHYDKAQDLWDLFRKSECVSLLEKAEIISEDDSYDIANEAMYLAIQHTKND
jgi:hypothetical protein